MGIKSFAAGVCFVGALVLVGCGGEETSTSSSCSSNSSCNTDEICHPTAKVCVKTCQSPSDCPSSGQSCTALAIVGTDAGTATKVCQCSGASQCDTSDVCSDLDKVCVAKCTSNASCPAGRDCDTATGQCKQTSCNPASTTLGTNGGPDICSYGQSCVTNACVAVPEGTCSQATGGPAWNKSGKQAPVITSATVTYTSSTNSANECAGGVGAALVTVRFYAPNNLTTHSAFSDLQNHVKFRTLSSGSFFGVNFSRQDPPTQAKFGEMVVGIACGSSQREAALYIADEAGNTSNIVCLNW